MQGRDSLSRRLTERFSVGDKVKIRFADDKDGGWLPGQVVTLAHPGVWVRTEDGSHWFVTHGKRIRKLQELRDGD